MRVAFILENDIGAQIFGITAEEASRLARNGEYRLELPGFVFRVLVDEKAEPMNPAKTPPIPWPQDL